MQGNILIQKGRPSFD